MSIEPNLDTLLLFLARFGEPTIFNHSKGWYCKLEVFVTGTGTKLEISSDFKMPAPFPAALQCAQRLRDAFARMEAQAADRSTFNQYVEALSGTAQETLSPKD